MLIGVTIKLPKGKDIDPRVTSIFSTVFPAHTGEVYITANRRILIAEDDEFVQQLLAAYFQQEGFQVSLVSSGHELMAMLDSEPQDLLLLDLGLPDEDGLVLMRQIRARSSMPVIVLTARQGREDKLTALEMGADDYLIKPCDPKELVLRVGNLLSRSAGADGQAANIPSSRIIRFESWLINLDSRSLLDVDDNEVHLSRAEFNLLAALVKASNRVLSRAQLLGAISVDDSSPSERMIDVVIARLRRKLERDPKNPTIIKTMVGIGYRFSASAKVE